MEREDSTPLKIDKPVVKMNHCHGKIDKKKIDWGDTWRKRERVKKIKWR